MGVEKEYKIVGEGRRGEGRKKDRKRDIDGKCKECLDGRRCRPFFVRARVTFDSFNPIINYSAALSSRTWYGIMHVYLR